MIHKLLAGKGKMKRGLSLLLCLALLGSSVISSNVTAEAESDVTVEAVEILETEEAGAAENVEEAAAVIEESTAEEDVTVIEEPSTETVTDETEEPAEETAAETVDVTTETAAEETATETEGITDVTKETPAKETTEEEASVETDHAEESAIEKTAYSETVTVDGITVEASADAGVFPEGTIMSVTLLDANANETADQYNKAEAALEESNVKYDGFVAFDISFIDEDGDEIEPEDGSVSVKISMDASILGDDVDEGSLEVHHLAETGNGLEVETVADTADATEGTVEAADDGSVEAEFTVDSFSTFTITWSDRNNSTYFKITVHYIDTDGSEIKADASNIEINNIESQGTTYIFADYSENVTGSYSYKEARVDSTSGSIVTRATFTETQNNHNITRTLTFYNENNSVKSADYNTSTVSYDVYLIYEEVVLETVDTVNSVSKGITINLFDYNDDVVNGENGNFLFTGDGWSTTSASWNSWVSGRGVIQGILESTMGSDGYPTFSSWAGNMSSNYLFSTSSTSNTVNANLNYLFIASIYEETGYYEYDSSQYFATIVDDGDSNFTVYNTAYCPGDNTVSIPKFLPYNDLTTTTSLNGDANYHFGMTISFDFIQPKNGQASWTYNGKTKTSDMIFEFTGDDDVWVYIDDVLVLDMGGIHDAMSGSINFATGVVTINYVYKNGTTATETSTLYEIFAAAYGENWCKANMTQVNGNWIFNDYTEHSFNYYYLERGAGGSNCRIKFNLQPIDAGTIEVGKQITESNMADFNDADFTFKLSLYNEDSNAYVPYSGTYSKYTLDTDELVSENISTTDGTFTLKHNQYAKFTDTTQILANTKYKVEEIGVSTEIYDNVTINSTAATVTDDQNGTSTYSSGELLVDSTKVVMFYNSCNVSNLQNLAIEKELEGGTSTDNYTVYVEIGGIAYSGTYYLMNISEAYNSDGSIKTSLCTESTAKTTSNGIITLAQDQVAVILGVISDSSYSVEETGLDTEAKYNAVKYSKNGGTKQTEKVTGIISLYSVRKVEKVTVINSLKTTTITVNKLVTGNMGDLNKKFEFTLQVEKDGAYYSDGLTVYWNESETADTNPLIATDNKYTFNLSNGEYITITVPVGYVYTVTETSYASEGYTTTNDATNASNDGLSGTVASEGIITFTNTKYVSAPTGLTRDVAPYVAALAIALGGAVLMFVSRRRRV